MAAAQIGAHRSIFISADRWRIQLGPLRRDADHGWSGRPKRMRVVRRPLMILVMPQEKRNGAQTVLGFEFAGEVGDLLEAEAEGDELD